MDTTICPWCHTEIVWDEELGPEETCPHCDNELSGYRTVSLSADELGEEEDDDFGEEEETEEDDLWGEEDRSSVVPVFNGLDKYRDAYDLDRYDTALASVLDGQEEVPECPQCHELMVLAGTRTVEAEQFRGIRPAGLGTELLTAPFAMNLHVCPSCFLVQESLTEEFRSRWIRNIGGTRK
ncbi:hypothetical protein F4V43_07675 [Paenibacillus spiritus]|uniref:Uncharacterized protein n=1 Tax=Paenibacillus spiritus TaxID=2496557 RepID=A0A5J5GB61_9BACL|nr:hypothetical protein [Paenibacillus spiritus]KAA9005345.1 hypothetical protein F4V43_07675 [Paenibacillus spiritus]